MFGLLLVNGLAAITAAIPSLLFLRWRPTKNSPAFDAPDAQP
jgi:hypothetical protein